MKQNWEESTKRQIHTEIGKAEDSLQTSLDEAQDVIQTIIDLINEDDVDVDAVRSALEQLRDVGRFSGHAGFDIAKDIDSLLTADLDATLRGEEPPGYSKSDGGAAYDAYHGAEAMSRNFKRNLGWPLRLHQWETEKAELVSGPPETDPEFEKITVEGTEVHKKRIGGVEVKIVIDETERDGPI